MLTYLLDSNVRKAHSSIGLKMKFHPLTVSLVSLSSLSYSCVGFSTQQNVRSLQSVTLRSTAEAPAIESLTNDIISKLQFREAQGRLEQLQLDTSGTLSAMRARLRSVTGNEGVYSTPVGDEEVPVSVTEQEKLNEVRCG